MASMNICKYDLRVRFFNALPKYEHYPQVKEVLQEERLDKKYEDYQQKIYILLIFKGRLYVTNCIDLKRMVLDGIH